ncbi:glycine zipper 2TM domain-containing protein [Erythrobacter litoralis]|nr:glycine zipper 2TM domain-containing protein [Erythrobacter litoralis]
MNYDRNYGQPVRRDTRIWRGDDGRYYCRRDNGTTGLLVGAGVGALLGHEVAGRGGDRTLGAIIGGAAGALLGRTIDRSSTRCG